MRVTLLGHATVLVEMGPMKILMDPVLQDPFEDGMVVSCPKREIDIEQLPHIDIIISHRHPDHFDLPSLDRLSRSCQVCCPADPLISHALKLLGFRHVNFLEPGKPLRLEKMELLPTRSENQAVRECGILFRDETGCFWNQVDTEISPITINTVLKHCTTTVDLLFAMYASQNFEFFESLDKSFPYETHRQNLQNVLTVRPRLTVPGSAGFRFFGDHEWLNRFLFPISRELFLDDLKSLDATLEAAIMNPGDVAELTNGEVKIRREASPFSRTLEDDTHRISFIPTSPVPPLTDPNPEGYELSEMEQAISQVVEDGLFRYCAEHARDWLEAAGKYFASQVIYGIEVVFPQHKMNWTIDFRTDPIRLLRGRDSQANVVHQIAASALNGWILRRKSFFYIRAYSRRFTNHHRIYGDAAGVHVIPVQLPDLLMHYLIYVAKDSSDSARQRIEYEIRQILQGRSIDNRL